MKLLFKYLFLFCTGGAVYSDIEILFRGHTHWTMYIVGGVCFILLGLMNEVTDWEISLFWQAIDGGIIITLVEFVAGCIVNLWLGWNVWDYSNMPFNLLGQICLPFSAMWCLLSVIGIILDDWLRYIFFGEEKPRYKII
jgi:uncharacterized membrane protein